MKVSENWLREWINPDISTEVLVEQLTMAGLEVDGVEQVGGELSGVIVGEILEATQHPDADKLRVCRVSGHSEGEKQVVCGAPNARVGLKIPFATVGAKLPGDFKIKKAKLRGVESFGMLCGQTELALGDDDSGLWELPSDAPIGEDLTQYLKLNDHVIEVDLTPNRGDCLSVRGLAREIACLNDLVLKEPTQQAIPPQTDDTYPVTLSAPKACPKYVGRVIRNIRNTAATPLWMVEKLRRSGIRSISPVVDVTNYVLLELGQPMHAFDMDKLNGSITVRHAADAEKLVLLDEREVTLRPETLVIADQSGPLAIAGVMGGLHSGVTENSQHIFLESAFFEPTAIAGTARHYAAHTDSSHRFERGVDHQLQKRAIERATELLLDIVGGEPGPVTVVEEVSYLPQPVTVDLSRSHLNAYLGLALDRAEVENILTKLGLETGVRDDEHLTLAIPSHRFDIASQVDLIEEVARIYGYDRLPTRMSSSASALLPHSEKTVGLAALKQHLISRGYQEAITYSFVDPKLQTLFFPDEKAVSLRNPISADMADMRRSLIPGLVSTLVSNLNRQQTRAKLFESGLCFISPTGGLKELQQITKLAGLIYGNVRQQNWSDKTGHVDFFDLKGDVESLIDMAGQASIEFNAPGASAPSFLHPGQCAWLAEGGDIVGVIGALHPTLQKSLDIGKPVYVFEIAVSVLSKAALPAFEPVSKQPEVSRDLAILVDKKWPMASIDGLIRREAGPALTDLNLFDVYSGQGIDPSHRSLAFSLTFQDPSRTLKDTEINAAMDKVVAGLASEFDASLR